jgi:hypothetical protein
VNVGVDLVKTLMDVRTLDDIKTVAVDSTRQFEVLSVDPVSQLACLAGPLGLSCVDHRVGTQVGQVPHDTLTTAHARHTTTHGTRGTRGTRHTTHDTKLTWEGSGGLG